MSDQQGGAPRDFEERLRNLESQNRSLRRMALLTMVGVAIAMTVLVRWVVVRRENRARFDTIEAEHFVVRDSLGGLRGELGMWDGIVRLVLGGDERGAKGIVMGVAPESVSRSVSSQLILKSGGDGPNLILTDNPSIHFGRTMGYTDLYVGLRPNGRPEIGALDSMGRQVMLDSIAYRR